jgi:hypothetical protein
MARAGARLAPSVKALLRHFSRCVDSATVTPEQTR